MPMGGSVGSGFGGGGAGASAGIGGLGDYGGGNVDINNDGIVDVTDSRGVSLGINSGMGMPGFGPGGYAAAGINNAGSAYSAPFDQFTNDLAFSPIDMAFRDAFDDSISGNLSVSNPSRFSHSMGPAADYGYFSDVSNNYSSAQDISEALSAGWAQAESQGVTGPQTSLNDFGSMIASPFGFKSTLDYSPEKGFFEGTKFDITEAPGIGLLLGAINPALGGLFSTGTSLARGDYGGAVLGALSLGAPGSAASNLGSTLGGLNSLSQFVGGPSTENSFASSDFGWDSVRNSLADLTNWGSGSPSQSSYTEGGLDSRPVDYRPSPVAPVSIASSAGRSPLSYLGLGTLQPQENLTTDSTGRRFFT